MHLLHLCETHTITVCRPTASDAGDDVHAPAARHQCTCQPSRHEQSPPMALMAQPLCDQKCSMSWLDAMRCAFKNGCEVRMLQARHAGMLSGSMQMWSMRASVLPKRCRSLKKCTPWLSIHSWPSQPRTEGLYTPALPGDFCLRFCFLPPLVGSEGEEGALRSMPPSRQAGRQGRSIHMRPGPSPCMAESATGQRAPAALSAATSNAHASCF